MSGVRRDFWVKVLLAVLTLAGGPACDSKSDAGSAASVALAAPLVSEEDRRLLEELKRKKAVRADLEANPSKYVVSGDGKVAVFDKGIINTYTEIRGYPLHNTSEFDILSLEADVKMLKADGTVLATVPVQFKGGLLAGEDKVLEATSPTVQGDAAKFMVQVTKVKLRSE